LRFTDLKCTFAPVNFTIIYEFSTFRRAGSRAMAARDFARNELLPGVIERDENMKFPTEQIKKLGELGFLGMMVDPKYGGSGMDTCVLRTGYGGDL
jgi:alkylation response protein AidB-like acyl-CoA dehydrogenase